MKVGFWQALVFSLAAHSVIYGGAKAWEQWRRRRSFDSMDIDLSRSSLMPQFTTLSSQRPSAPPEDWFEGDVRKLAPAPVLAPQTAKVEEQEPASAPCPAPCPDNPGDWAPASDSVKRPEWLDGTISEDDYPADARAKNITGRVVVQVHLSVNGEVLGVTLLQGSDASLNAKTLEKLSKARFSPCVNAAGQAFPCNLTVPITWTLD